MDNTEEESILTRFRNLYEYFPNGKTTQPDKPDFIVDGELIIGIEVTQVFKDQDSPKGSLIRAKDSFQRHLLSNIVFDLNSTDFPKCIIAIHLNDEVFSKSLNAREISKLCFAVILTKQIEIYGNGYYNFENEGELPDIIEGYSIGIFDGIQKTEFIETGGAVGLQLTNEHIQFVLNKKEKAKKHFQKCDSYWLLIKEGSGEADYFGVSIINNSTLETTFDKVFLLRQRNSEIVELK